MSSPLRQFLTAASLANLYLIGQWFSRLSTPWDAYLFRSTSLSVFQAEMTAFTALTVAFWLVLAIVDRFPNRAVWNLGHVLLLAAVLVSFECVRREMGLSVNHPYLFSGRLLFGDWGLVLNEMKITVLVSVLIACFIRFRQAIFSGMRRVLLGFSLATLVTIPRTILESHSDDTVVRSRPGRSRAFQPVVWLIFDELDEHFAFEARPRGVSLPAFDDLAARSLRSRHAFSPASATLLSMPGYFIGKTVLDANPISDRDLRLSVCDDRKVNFSQLRTVWDQAHEEGFTTGIVGWNHPYCRLFPQLNFCHFQPLRPFPDEESLLSNTIRIVRDPIVPNPTSDAASLVRHHGLMAQVKPALEKMTDLTFLHYSVPHQSGVYEAGAPTFRGSRDKETNEYFNNLLVADRALDFTLREIARTLPTAVVIVSSDHHWRYVPLGGVDWERGAAREWRVPFLIHFPGQQRSIELPGEINTVVTAYLAMAILRGEVRGIGMAEMFLERAQSQIVVKVRDNPTEPPSWRCLGATDDRGDFRLPSRS